jgi:hypothetical protein
MARAIGSLVYFPCPFESMVIDGNAQVVYDNDETWTALANLQGEGGHVFFLPTARLYDDQGLARAEAQRMISAGEQSLGGERATLLQRVVGKADPQFGAGTTYSGSTYSGSSGKHYLLLLG